MRRRRTPAIVQWNGIDSRITHRGRDITEDELDALPSDGIRCIDFRPPSHSTDTDQ